MNDSPLASQPVKDFLQNLITLGHLELTYTLDSTPGKTPELSVELSGPDTGMLTARQGELLLAIEHIAAKLLELEPEQHDRISFDAGHYKVLREEELRQSAQFGIARVRSTGQPHAFPPMSSRERRLLHLMLKESGLPTASSGEGPRRFVVLYPEGEAPEPVAVPSTQDRAQSIRNRFRRR